MTFRSIDEDDETNASNGRGIYYLFLLVIVFGVIVIGFSFQYMNGQLSSTVFTANQYPLSVLTNGSRPLIANWDVGSYNITANYFIGNMIGNVTGYIASRTQILDLWDQPFWSNIPDVPTVWNTNQIPTLSLSSSNVSDWGTYINQALKTTSAVTHITLDTGQGANELYDMNQDVLTTSSPTFNVLSLTGIYATDFGTVLKYDFDEGIGSIVFDSSPHGSDGTVIGATWVAGNFGKALSFDGSGDKVTVNDDVSLDFGTNSFSIVMWEKIGGVNYNILIEKLVDLTHAGFAFYTDTESVNKYLRGFVQTTNLDRAVATWLDITAFDGTWKHLVIVVDRTSQKIKVYVNSVKSSIEADLSTQNVDNSANLLIGDSCFNSDLLGIIDEVRIYNRALSTDEVKTLWLSGQGKYSSSVVISDKFRVLGTDLATDFSVINGVGTFAGGIVSKYDTGDYEIAWGTYSPPAGINGMVIVVYNTNVGVLASRLYVYTASAWHYIAIP